MLLFAALPCALLFPVRAEDVLVRASGFPEDVFRRSASATVLGREDIAALQARSVPDLLGRVAGVATTTNGSFGQAAAPMPSSAWLCNAARHPSAMAPVLSPVHSSGNRPAGVAPVLRTPCRSQPGRARRRARRRPTEICDTLRSFGGCVAQTGTRRSGP